MAQNLLKQALARLSADFTHFLKIHLIGDRTKPARMAIHGAFEPISCRQLRFFRMKRRGLTGALLTQAEDAAQEFRRFEIVNPAVQAMKTCRFFLHIERHSNPTIL